MNYRYKTISEFCSGEDIFCLYVDNVGLWKAYSINLRFMLEHPRAEGFGKTPDDAVRSLIKTTNIKVESC